MFPFAQTPKILTPVDAPVVTVGAYSAEDAVGGLLDFAGAAVSKGGGGLIFGATLIDYDKVAAHLILTLFDRKPTTVPANNAAFTYTDADAAFEIAKFVFDDAKYNTDGGSSFCTGELLNAEVKEVLYRCGNGGRHIYGQLKCVATPTYLTAGALQVKLHVLTLK